MTAYNYNIVLLLIHFILIMKAKYGAEYMCGVNVNIDTIIYNRIGLTV